MAKQTFPGYKTGGGVLSKVIGSAVVLLLLVIVVEHPAAAANCVRVVMDGLMSFIRQVGS